MAVEIAAARQLTYDAARVFDGRGERALEPAMAKLFACDVAVRTTQEAQLLHGGWGFAEEFPICRYVVDALVLPIFEGVKPILELKVIARKFVAVVPPCGCSPSERSSFGCAPPMGVGRRQSCVPLQ